MDPGCLNLVGVHFFVKIEGVQELSQNKVKRLYKGPKRVDRCDHTINPLVKKK